MTTYHYEGQILCKACILEDCPSARFEDDDQSEWEQLPFRSGKNIDDDYAGTYCRLAVLGEPCGEFLAGGCMGYVNPNIGSIRDAAFDLKGKIDGLRRANTPGRLTQIQLLSTALHEALKRLEADIMRVVDAASVVEPVR